MESVPRRLVLTATLGGAVGLVACAPGPPTPGGTPRPSPSPEPTRPTAASPTPRPTVDTRPRWPLTGRLLEGADGADRAAVAVKVPDNRNEHPQVGLNDADIVFVQRDGYPDRHDFDGTRLMPVFHSKMAEAAAPVRSIRPVDAPLLAPMRAVVGSSGGAPWVVAYLARFGEYIRSDLVYIETKGTGAYSVDRSRIYRYKGRTEYDRALVCHPEVLGELADQFRGPPPLPYLPFAIGNDRTSTEAGRPATEVSVPWKGEEYVMSYRLDPATGTYLRSLPWGEHVLADGSRVSTDNVLVIRNRWSREKLVQGSGGPEPIHHIVDGDGTFVYAHAGRAVTGTWTKGAVAAPFTFTLDDGTPLRLAPGRTFVELAAIDAPVAFG